MFLRFSPSIARDSSGMASIPFVGPSTGLSSLIIVQYIINNTKTFVPMKKRVVNDILPDLAHVVSVGSFASRAG